MASILVNGMHLLLAGITGSAGDKNGVALINVKVNVPDLVTALTLAPADVAAALGVSNIICIDRPLSQDPDGEFTVTFQLQGFNQTFTFQQAQNLMQVAWKPNKAQDPLQTHPHYKDFVTDYGPLDADGKFPQTYTPKSGSGSSGFSQNGSNKNATNPLFGVDNWFRYGGVFSRTYAVTEVDPSVWDNIGVLVDYPPNADLLAIPHFTNRKWLHDAPDIDQHGNAFRITENWQLTGITNGSEAIIYAEAQLTQSK